MTFRFTAVTDLIHFTTSVRAASSVRLQSRIIQKHFDRRFHSGYSTLPKRCQHRLTKTREEILADFHSTFRNISMTQSLLPARVLCLHQSTLSLSLTFEKENNSIFGLSQSNIIHSRQQSNKASSNMATTFSKVMIRAGQGTQRPKVGDVVLMEYTGKNLTIVLYIYSSVKVGCTMPQNRTTEAISKFSY